MSRFCPRYPLPRQAPENLDAICAKGFYPLIGSTCNSHQTRGGARDCPPAHGDPVILRIDARAAHAQGQVFYHPTDEIYLTDTVPRRLSSAYHSNKSAPPLTLPHPGHAERGFSGGIHFILGATPYTDTAVR